MGGNDTYSLQPLNQSVPKQGFETRVTPPDAAYVRINALDRDGNILDSTDVVEMATGRKLSDRRLDKQ